MNMIFSKYKIAKSTQSNIQTTNIQIPNINQFSNTNTNTNTNTLENNKFISSVRFGMIDRILYNNTNCKSCGK